MDDKDFEGIIEGLSEAVAFVHGKDVPGLVVHIPSDIDVKAIRTKLHMTQAKFAERHGFSLGAVRDWEQGRVVPDASTRAFLKVIALAPEIVEQVLESA